ncbi:PIR Superfamily Protein [Plasmodium malariae]|uniref:PIR Superfamily Protein n=1 Tax=Plasmodium malariae TaxID=5858 RepID=A0A1A8XCN9_PLAMA|nr:PIR Superfamily Protein [Plasmodium malariae]
MTPLNDDELENILQKLTSYKIYQELNRAVEGNEEERNRKSFSNKEVKSLCVKSERNLEKLSEILEKYFYVYFKYYESNNNRDTCMSLNVNKYKKYRNCINDLYMNSTNFTCCDIEMLLCPYYFLQSSEMFHTYELLTALKSKIVDGCEGLINFGENEKFEQKLNKIDKNFINRIAYGTDGRVNVRHLASGVHSLKLKTRSVEGISLMTLRIDISDGNEETILETDAEQGIRGKELRKNLAQGIHMRNLRADSEEAKIVENEIQGIHIIPKKIKRGSFIHNDIDENVK